MKKVIYGLMFTAVLFLTGCSDNISTPTDQNSTSDITLQKNGLPLTVHKELQTLKSATAKYHDIKQAIADGYIDIHVVIPHMGHHYLNPAYMADNVFNINEPEILVYQHTDNGKMRLVAVEFGTPLSNPAPPEGFTGSMDVWTANTGAGIWALHAWIWEYNPDGVFASFNHNVP